jgi:hypothetical protein
MKTTLQKFLDQEWTVALARKAALAPRSVFLAFTVSLAVNIVCWFYDLAQFPLGDHDVGYQSGIPFLSGGRSGRWFTACQLLMALSILTASPSAGLHGKITPPHLLIFSIILASCAIALYQSSITTWCVLFSGCILMRLLQTERASAKNLLATVRTDDALYGENLFVAL